MCLNGEVWLHTADKTVCPFKPRYWPEGNAIVFTVNHKDPHAFRNMSGIGWIMERIPTTINLFGHCFGLITQSTVELADWVSNARSAQRLQGAKPKYSLDHSIDVHCSAPENVRNMSKNGFNIAPDLSLIHI